MHGWEQVRAAEGSAGTCGLCQLGFFKQNDYMQGMGSVLIQLWGLC